MLRVSLSCQRCLIHADSGERGSIPAISRAARTILAAKACACPCGETKAGQKPHRVQHLLLQKARTARTRADPSTPQRKIMSKLNGLSTLTIIAHSGPSLTVQLGDAGQDLGRQGISPTLLAMLLGRRLEDHMRNLLLEFTERGYSKNEDVDKFLDEVPRHRFGGYGGNTPCIEVKSRSRQAARSWTEAARILPAGLRSADGPLRTRHGGHSHLLFHVISTGTT